MFVWLVLTRTSCCQELASFPLEAGCATGCFVLCFGHCRKCRIVRSVDCGPSRPRSQLGRLHDCRINPQVCVPYRVSATDNSAHRRFWFSATDDRRRTIRRSGHRFCQRHFRGVPAQPVHAWPPLRNILTPSIGSGPCIWVMVEVRCRAPPQLWSWAATCLAADLGGNHLAEAVFFFPRSRVADSE